MKLVRALIFVAFGAAPAIVVAQTTEIFKCVDGTGRPLYTSDKRDTMGKKCELVSREVNVVPAQRQKRAPSRELGRFPRETPAGLWWQYWNYGRGRARMLAKHRAVPKLRQVIPVLNLCLLIASAAIAPWAPLAAAIWPALYLALLVGVSLYLAAVKRSVCGLGAGLALVIMHSAWALGFLAVIPAILKGVRA